jgi:hypothetical protein
MSVTLLLMASIRFNIHGKHREPVTLWTNLSWRSNMQFKYCEKYLFLSTYYRSGCSLAGPGRAWHSPGWLWTLPDAVKKSPDTLIWSKGRKAHLGWGGMIQSFGEQKIGSLLEEGFHTQYFFWQGSNTVFFGLHFIGIVRDALRVASGFIFCSDLNVIWSWTTVILFHVMSGPLENSSSIC